MVLLSPGAAPTGCADDLSTEDAHPAPEPLTSFAGWDLDQLPRPKSPRTDVGATTAVLGGDVVTSAPELARLTGNLARVHHESAAGGGRRLVYGGHAIGLALHHLTQAFPGIVGVAGWHGCDHLAPVHEDDVVTSTVTVVEAEGCRAGSRP